MGRTVKRLRLFERDLNVIHVPCDPTFRVVRSGFVNQIASPFNKPTRLAVGFGFESALPSPDTPCFGFTPEFGSPAPTPRARRIRQTGSFRGTNRLRGRLNGTHLEDSVNGQRERSGTGDTIGRHLTVLESPILVRNSPGIRGACGGNTEENLHVIPEVD